MDIEKTIRDYLPQIVHMSVASVQDNMPWVWEVHFAYDKDLNLYYCSKPTRRHSIEVANNPNVAGNIVKQHSLGESPVGVYFEGTVKMLKPGKEQMKAFECIKERFGADEAILEEAKQEDGHKFYKITVKNWYVFGRFNTPNGQKYLLPWKQ